jgi:uncharacterized membrane protein
MNGLILLSFVAALLLLTLLPLLFEELMATSLGKLHLSPESAVLLIIAIMAGGLVNIPVRRIRHARDVEIHPLAAYGIAWPQLRRVRQETVVAVNLGGCIIPTALAIYELARAHGRRHPFAVDRRRRPQHRRLLCHGPAGAGIGIALPGLVPALIAAAWGCCSLARRRRRWRSSPASQLRWWAPICSIFGTSRRWLLGSLASAAPACSTA